MRNEKIQPPKMLYKYRQINEFSKKILLEGEIYFATTNELKDPLEKSFSFTNGSWVVDENNKRVYLSPEQYTQRLLNSVRKGGGEPYGILSFCESKKEIQMYKEYADDFKGICIGFDWEIFGLTFPGSCPLEKNIPRKVIYQSPIKIEKEYIPPQKWIEIFTTKSIDFSYEKEWRMFYTKGKFSSDNVRYAIREIVFGHNVSQEHILQVKEWIKDLDGINLFIIDSKFELEIVPRIF
jgi:hypothetical protein